jgi:hypothetical protein
MWGFFSVFSVSKSKNEIHKKYQFYTVDFALVETVDDTRKHQSDCIRSSLIIQGVVFRPATITKFAALATGVSRRL